VVIAVLTVLVSGDAVRAAHALGAPAIEAGHGPARAQQSSAQVNDAAWYVGTTSAGTRIDFRTSPSGGWVRDFHFGAPELTGLGATYETMPDGNFPLIGLPVSQGGFAGDLQAQDDTPNNADPTVVTVSGHFINPQQVTGTLQAGDWGGGFDPLTFTATRAGSLPGRPSQGRGYVGMTDYGTGVSLRVSRSGRRVTAIRIASVRSDCKYSGAGTTITLVKSFPAAGLRQDRDGVFGGVVSSETTASGRPARTRVRVSVLFLSPTEATGTIRPTGSFRGPCDYETLTFRATQNSQVVGPAESAR
jgi:hypothetical protein